MFENPEAVLGVMVPIISVIMVFGYLMVRGFLDYQKKREMFQLHHSERMAAIDKGIEVPALPPEFFHSDGRRSQGPANHLLRGLLWLLVGSAVTAALYFRGGSQNDAWWGLVIVAVGVANLIFYVVAGRDRGQTAEDSAK